MPSSLVFAALALAWIVVLVPMVARRRQEVRRTADSALAARVLRRGDAAMARARPEEVPAMPVASDRDNQEPSLDRRYRPGRGGFDPYAAELAARARYALRQRVVFGLLLTALASGLLAGFAMPVLWWLHAGVDLLLVSYLTYLRRQVHIEQDIRRRRLERARTRRAIESGRPQPSRPEASRPEAPRPEPHAPDNSHDATPPPRDEPAPAASAPLRPAVPPGAAIVDLDDEDPAFHDFDGDPPAPYRRAAGE